MTLDAEADREAAAEDAPETPEPERVYVCAACEAEITRPAHRADVHGAHEHRRANPSGVSFHLGCFGSAPGAASIGEPTEHWTWFLGCAWSFAHCRTCGAHLGWRYEGAFAFWGLILKRLRLNERS